MASHHLIGLDLYTGAVLLDEVIDPPGTDPASSCNGRRWPSTDGRVIIGFGGNDGDCGDYHGLVVSAPEDGIHPHHYTVANLPGDSQGAVWMGGAAPTVDAQGNVWVATGNSAFHSSSDPYDESDGVLELSPTMQLLHAFAPSTWYADNGRGPRPRLDARRRCSPTGWSSRWASRRPPTSSTSPTSGGVGGQVAVEPGFCFVRRGLGRPQRDPVSSRAATASTP